MSERAYLDWNATAPLRPQARAAMAAALELAGNASSVHAEGRAARKTIEEARAQVAALAGVEAKQVTFTSGGTEANMTALTPALGERLFVSAVEHPSVRSGGRFTAENVEQIPVTNSGIVDLDALAAQLRKAKKPLVSIMAANNETGIVQPISQAAAIVHEAGGMLHVDCAQTAGKIPCDLHAMGADLATLAAHKLGGPQGIGALIVMDEKNRPNPLLTGGGHERGLRPGTENVAAIAGFGAAVEAAAQGLVHEAAHAVALSRALEAGLKAAAPDVVVFGEGMPRLPNTTYFSLKGVKAETAVISFDLEGVAVSSGSACSSGKVAGSHVLAAMGAEPALAQGAIRISLGWSTTEADIARALNAWNKVISSLLKRQPGIAA